MGRIITTVYVRVQNRTGNCVEVNAYTPSVIINRGFRILRKLRLKLNGPPHPTLDGRYIFIAILATCTRPARNILYALNRLLIYNVISLRVNDYGGIIICSSDTRDYVFSFHNISHILRYYCVITVQKRAYIKRLTNTAFLRTYRINSIPCRLANW